MAMAETRIAMVDVWNCALRRAISVMETRFSLFGVRSYTRVREEERLLDTVNPRAMSSGRVRSYGTGYRMIVFSSVGNPVADSKVSIGTEYDYGTAQ